jgi:hypothetical protein
VHVGKRISQAPKQRFALDDAATDELIAKATEAEHESV